MALIITPVYVEPAATEMGSVGTRTMGILDWLEWHKIATKSTFRLEEECGSTASADQ
jgi:hypothetical protein